MVEAQTPPNFDTLIVNAEELTPEQKIKIKEAKDLLNFHGIPLNKVRFAFDRTFTYDVDANVVNPKYTVLRPRKRKYHVIEIGKPENLMSISMGLYQTDDDNFVNVKKIIKKSKRGVVIMLDLSSIDFHFNYSFLMANLDNAVDFHKNSQENL